MNHRVSYPVAEWIERIRAGETLSGISREVGLSRQRIHQRIVEYDKVGYLAAKGDALLSRQSQYPLDEWIELNRSGRSLRSIAEEWGISGSHISGLLKRDRPQNVVVMEESEESRLKRGAQTAIEQTLISYSDGDLLAALRAADEITHRANLRIQDYRAYSARHPGTPSSAIILNRFGKWCDACEAAGVPCVRGGGRRDGQPRVDWISPETCIEAVVLCRNELGLTRVPTAPIYDDWSRGRDGVPGQATVRKRLGGWRGVIAAVRDLGYPPAVLLEPEPSQ